MKINKHDDYGVSANETRIRIGDVMNINGRLHICDLANQSRARMRPMSYKAVKIKTVMGDEVEFAKKNDQRVSIATTAERSSIVERRGEAGLEDFLATKKSRGEANNTNNTNESDSSMAKEAKSKKNKAQGGGLAATAKKLKEAGVDGIRSSGRLGQLFGHSVCSVLKAAGKAGATVHQAREFLKANSVKAKDVTVGLNLSAGRNGKGTAAPLTKAQLDEILSIPNPEPEVKEPKKSKKEKTEAVAA